MDILYSPSGIADFRHPAQGVADMSNAGMKTLSLDISICCSGFDLENYGKPKKEHHLAPQSCGKPQNAHRAALHGSPPAPDNISFVCTPEAILQHFEPFLAQCRRHSISIPFLRVPRLPWDTKRTDLNPLLEQIARSAIRLCGKIGCRYLTVPPLFAGLEKGAEWTANHGYYLRLAEAAREHHVTLLLENQCRSHNGHLLRGICSDGSETAEWIDRLNKEAAEQDSRQQANEPVLPLQAGSTSPSPVFGFCLDTGICTLCGQDMQAFTAALGFRLEAVILRDCGREQESSLLPFTSAYQGQPQTDWLSLIRGLRDINFDGSLILDFADTAAAFSPLLRPQLLPLAKSTAEYFKWQIELERLLKKYQSIVLFGAGNMCRNYMKCYGRQYPPLFTCDNNPAVWGTDICGLEVRPPEVLKELPENCGVFICNIYYREIEKQLLEMGIHHIEFFNDEYMPSFHFDRMEMY